MNLSERSLNKELFSRMLLKKNSSKYILTII